MDERIYLIAPYQGLIEIGHQANKMLNTNVQLVLGDEANGVGAALEAQRKGAQVLISRGGTASILRKKTNIPVVEIRVLAYDILEALYNYHKTDTPIGIAGHRSVVKYCRNVSQILGIPIKEYIIDNQETLDLAEAQRDIDEMITKYGLRAMVGDTLVNKLKLENINTRLITSCVENVIDAYEEAFQILRILEQEREKRKQFQAVLDFVHDGVVVTNETGEVTFLNSKVEEVFRIKKEETMYHNISCILADGWFSKVMETGIADIQQIQETETGTIMANMIPITVDGKNKGVVFTFQKSSEIQDAEQKIRENLYSEGFTTKYSFKDMLTRDAHMLRLIEVAKSYARTDATILIEGESGTGKEVLAQSVHSVSPRAQEPFVAVNCAVLPAQLLESELFGYEQGAFTGAKKGGKMGLFELAHKGTVFLDEIGEMDCQLQVRLLRVLEERQVMRLGSSKIIPVNIRIIAATNANLRTMVHQGKFRADLYYRLNVLNLKAIPLRERKTDIEFLAYYFMRKCNERYGRQVEKLSQDVIAFLSDYSFPGNIRELKNVMERIVLTVKDDIISMESIDFIIQELCPSQENSEFAQFEDLVSGTLQEIKGKIVKKVLLQENFNKSRTAKRLGIDRSTVERYLLDSRSVV